MRNTHQASINLLVPETRQRFILINLFAARSSVGASSLDSSKSTQAANDFISQEFVLPCWLCSAACFMENSTVSSNLNTGSSWHPNPNNEAQHLGISWRLIAPCFKIIANPLHSDGRDSSTPSAASTRIFESLSRISEIPSGSMLVSRPLPQSRSGSLYLFISSVCFSQ